MKKIFRKILSVFFAFLPHNAPGFIYTKLLHPWPLRQITNAALLRIVPDQISLPEGILFLNQKDPVISGALAIGVFEKHETALFRSVLKPGTVVLDVGANIGYYTLIASHHIGPSGKVFTFEPEPNNYTLLQKNIKKNKVKNVLAFQLGLSDKKYSGALYLSDDNQGNHSLSQKSAGGDTAIEISLITADEVLTDAGISKVDVVKMDIEGAEPMALKGMEAVLFRSSPCVLFCEFYPQALTRQGFNPVVFLESISRNGFLVNEIQEEDGRCIPVEDFFVFAKRFAKGGYTNLYCIKS